MTYHRHGKTPEGTPRFRCKHCRKTFVPLAKRRPKRSGERPYRTEDVFSALVNSTPINRVMEIYRLRPKTVYDVIDRAYRACLIFSAEREQSLSPQAAGHERLYIATDRQAYNVNWRLREDKRNVLLRAVVSSEVRSGYVFPVHLNYDPHSDVQRINEIAEFVGDPAEPGIWRHFAHYWLFADYDERRFRVSHDALPAETIRELASTQLADVQRVYAQALRRWDVESPSDLLDSTSKLPDEGLQLREEYVLYAHFQLLRRQLESFEEAHFFVDQESGIRAAYMAAFGDWVRQERSHLFYVSARKGVTREERERAQREAKRVLNAAQEKYGSRTTAKIALLMGALEQQSGLVGHWQDRWTPYPWEYDQGEVEKRFSHQTRREGQDQERLARILLRCSLHPSDVFMQKVRRRLTGLERGVPTAAGERRIWTGRAPYNPHMVIKLLEMLRVYTNYCKAPNEKRGNTPAMRLGLSRGPVELRKILAHG